MFCQQCSEKVSGRFCSNCGTPVEKPLATNWVQKIDYATLIRHPAIRNVIRQHAAEASKRISADEFLSLADNILPVMVPLSAIAKIGVPIYTKLGIKTGKNRSEVIASPPGKIMVSVLCFLARNDYALQQIRQLENGCVFEATLPSDLWSWKGTLFVTIAKDEGGTYVDVATEIKGQVFDWGKSNRCLNRLFEDLKTPLPALESMT